MRNMGSAMSNEGIRGRGINTNATTSKVNIRGLDRVILIATIHRIGNCVATGLK